MGGQWQARLDLRPRRGAMHAFLQRREPALARSDLADDPGPHAGVAEPIGDLADQLIGDCGGAAQREVVG